MTGPTTQEYQPLSQALRFQSQQPELPRLQLAPPEHHKQLPQAQAKPQQTQEQQEPQSSTSAVVQQPDERATSISSREVSPAAGVETSRPSNGQKRKSDLSKGASFKKRKTDQVQEQINDAPVQYSHGTHYPYTYTYPGAPRPTPMPGFSPPQAPNAPAEMSFNEFQWRLLNLCGEFYEAATELIRSTPHDVLSQAFQILDRGTGLDPISVLHDARRTCDMLLTNPQALSSAPPPPVALPLAALTSLTHLSSRSSASSAPTPASIIAPPSYYPPQPTSLVVESFSPKIKEKERAPINVQGTWKDEEIQKLKVLAEKYKIVDNAAVAEEEEEEEDNAQAAEGNGDGGEGESAQKSLKKPKTSEISEVDWDKVIREFGDGRSRHQLLIKATYLGLKPSSSLPGKKPKKKRTISTATLPPPLTFSSSSAKSIPTGYNPSNLGNAQSPSATQNVAITPPTVGGAQPAATTTSISPTHDSRKAATASPLPVPPQHLHTHTPYSQLGWYPHPQNPYYAYHQPMYYSPHPQGYGMQGYGMQPPPQGYYPPPYPVPPGTDVLPVEKPVQTRGKRKEARREDVSTVAARTTPIPPPSLPPKVSTTDITSSAKSAPAASTAVAPKPADAPMSDAPTSQLGQSLSSTNTPAATGSSGVLRRGPNNSLFTYTPLSHGTVTSTEPAKGA